MAESGRSKWQTGYPLTLDCVEKAFKQYRKRSLGQAVIRRSNQFAFEAADLNQLGTQFVVSQCDQIFPKSFSTESLHSRRSRKLRKAG